VASMAVWAWGRDGDLPCVASAPQVAQREAVATTKTNFSVFSARLKPQRREHGGSQ
jgi:hypothetical protein